MSTLGASILILFNVFIRFRQSKKFKCIRELKTFIVNVRIQTTETLPNINLSQHIMVRNIAFIEIEKNTSYSAMLSIREPVPHQESITTNSSDSGVDGTDSGCGTGSRMFNIAE